MNNIDIVDNLCNKFCLDNIKNNIVNYFIDNDIIINDDDDIKTKIEKFLLKYKRTIAMICLIILLIIGYYCDPYSIFYHYDKTDNQIQSGGAALAAKAQKTADKQAKSADKQAKKEMDKAAKSTAKEAAKVEKSAAKETASTEKAASKAAAPSFLEKRAASGKAKREAHGKAISDKKNALKEKIKNATPFRDAGRAFTDNADLIFQVFYSIAIFIVICIVTVPALAFIIVGIICHVVLKPKIEAIKAL